MVKDSIIKHSEQFISKNIYNYCFALGDYLIPKKLITNNRKIIDIEKNRLELLLDESTYSKNMKDFLIKNNIEFIREFIIIIQNVSLWNDILSSLNLPEYEFNIYKNINYFSLDYYLENSLTCIEIDSNYHKKRAKLDEARDIYLEAEFSIKTFRFFHFGEDKINDELIFSNLINRLNNNKINNISNLFNYRDIVLRDFLYNNEFFITMLDRFIDFVKMYNFFKRSQFVITEKDYRRLTKGIIFTQGTESIDFYQDFIRFVKELFNKEITICIGVVNYSIEDISYILTKKSNPLIIKDIINRYKYTPYWISKLIKIPDQLIYSVKPKVVEDKIILDYIKNLRLESGQILNNGRI